MRLPALLLAALLAGTPGAAQDGDRDGDRDGAEGGAEGGAPMLDAALDTAFAGLDAVANLPEALECAALFRALSALLDPQTEAGASFAAREGFLATVSAVLWMAAQQGEGMAAQQGEGMAAPQGEGMAADAAFAVLVPPLVAATGAFLAHMDRTAATSETPFDDALLARVDYCIGLHDALRED